MIPRPPAARALAALLLLVPAASLPAQEKPACAPGNGGLTLPAGFCATVLAEDARGARQLAVAPGGVLYVAMEDGDAGVLALRDRDGDGRAEERVGFGPAGANDVEVHDGYLYAALPDRILRWRLAERALAPDDAPEIIVGGLPDDGNHKAKSIAFGASGAMYVTIGSASNSCQQADRQAGSPGRDPCRELERRAGIWLFAAARPGQRFADGRRYATGLRNALALAVQPGTGALFAAVNGRDQLGDNWGFSDEANAENPAEELVAVEDGDDFGWPYCYYSTEYRKKVLAPEYGGDGRKVGRCAEAKDPLVAFPAHWAPLALAFSTGDAFGPEYREGLFVAFHGSWNRAPRPQSGYRVAFVPMKNGAPADEFQTFAIGGTATALRASGLAVGADGSLFIASDGVGKVWKVVRR
ncbi:MAG TPA: PQQ-dependent sugar dehydrogenase [Gemmatimonadales bacterium]|nr:PQQ-dependent sugar dehydrogenase [Gemmatimonadales bacterium]